MDIQPVISITNISTYIAKYAAKGETGSDMYEQLLDHILDSRVSDADHVRKSAGKLFVKLIAERDYSAQEVFIF